MITTISDSVAGNSIVFSSNTIRPLTTCQARFGARSTSLAALLSVALVALGSFAAATFASESERDPVQAAPLEQPAGAALESDTNEQPSLADERPSLETQLPVEPQSQARPNWVDDEATSPKFVESGPKLDPRQCDRAFNESLVKRANEFINRHVDDPRAASFIGYSLDQADQLKRFLRETFEETTERSFPDGVHQMHARYGLVEFDQSFFAQVDQDWSQVRTTSRLALLGVICAGVLLLLSTAFAYFKLDNATRGFYTGRLQFLAAVAILTLIAAGVVAARWVPWM